MDCEGLISIRGDIIGALNSAGAEAQVIRNEASKSPTSTLKRSGTNHDAVNLL